MIHVTKEAFFCRKKYLGKAPLFEIIFRSTPENWRLLIIKKLQKNN